MASDSGGNFVVVWRSAGQDGSSFGTFGQRFCPALDSVTISVNGTTMVCPNSTGGTATPTDDGGGLGTHQWGYRTTMGGFTNPIGGKTGTSNRINGASFGMPPETPGIYYLVCATFHECGMTTLSNEVVILVSSNVTGPVVKPPDAQTTTQTLCM